MANAAKPKPPRSRLYRFASALALACAVILCLTVILMILGPQLFTAPPFQLRANASSYDKVAQQIETGAILSDSPNSSIAVLPPDYRQLSPAKDGQVLIYRDGSTIHVLFYPGDSGAMTWVYMYASDDTPIDLAGECSGLQHERPNWFLFHCP